MGHSLQIFAWGMPRHAHVFSFTHNALVLHSLDVFTPKIRRKFLILTFLWIKTNVAYTRLEVIAKQRSALQVEFITGVQLICYFVLYYCFLQWDHLPNMAVGDLAFYYTLYLWRNGHSLYDLKLTSDVNMYHNRPFQMRAWSCITSYPLWGLPCLAYDNVNPAVVNSMMLHSSMHDLKRSVIVCAWFLIYLLVKGTGRQVLHVIRQCCWRGRVLGTKAPNLSCSRCWGRKYQRS